MGKRIITTLNLIFCLFKLANANDTLTMDETVVSAQIDNEVHLRERSGFSIATINLESEKNLTSDINEVLKRSSGVHLRETGGMGSSFNLSLNGLSGEQIRYFIDGVPMELFGPALTLNNFPVNLIENIEVYKGVVPVELASDALGGSIHLKTAKPHDTFADLSYSIGSFGTHQAAVNAQFINKSHSFYTRLLSFYNRAENDYTMKSVPVFDMELGNYENSIETDRFHDAYWSGMVQAETGILSQKWADQLALSFQYARNYKEYQHPDNHLNLVFGDFHTTSESMQLLAKYQKYFEKVDWNSNVSIGMVEQATIDTGSFSYNWAGDKIEKPQNDDMDGELFDRKSYMVIDDKTLAHNHSFQYYISDLFSLGISANHTILKREGDDRVNEFNKTFETPSTIQKWTGGLSFNTLVFNDRFQNSTFIKQYGFAGSITTINYDNEEEATEPFHNFTGFGTAISLALPEYFIWKASYEKAYRIPQSYELLGDGKYISANPNLQPEQSHNVNLGGVWNYPFNVMDIQAELGYFLRHSSDFIRFNPLGPFGEYENLKDVLSQGVEFSMGITVMDKIFSNTSVTYQDLRDASKTDEGLKNTNYGNRLPNQPYFFCNQHLAYEFSVSPKIGSMRVSWNGNYVHDFFLTWENQGDPSVKNVIPTQFTNDFGIEYSSPSGRINVSTSVKNVFDSESYDNFNIQKPGRSFYGKIRLHL